MGIKWLFTALCVFFVGTAADAAVTFYCDFDNVLDARYSQGNAAPIDRLKSEFVPGVIGNAVKVDRQAPTYYTDKNLSAEAGAVAFWVQPEWNGTDNPGYVTLFSGVGKLYKCRNQPYLTYWLCSRLVGARPDEYNKVKQFHLPAYGAGAWKKGEWRHVVLTWKREPGANGMSVRRAVYLDGKLNGSDVVSLQGLNIPALGFCFAVGGTGEGQASRAALDEFYAWDEALSVERVGQVYEAGKNGKTLDIKAAPESPAPPEVATSPAGASANLLANSSFEAGTEDWFPLTMYAFVDSGTAVHGKNSLRVDVGHYKNGVTAQCVKVVPDKEYSFSVYLKSEPSGMSVDLVVASGFNRIAGPWRMSQRVKVTGEWRRYEVAGVLKHFPKDAYGVSVIPVAGAAGNLYLDAAQLGQTPLGKYAPAAFVEAGSAVVGPTDGIFLDNEDIILDAYAAVNSPTPVKIRKTARMLDYYDREIFRWEKKVEADVNHPSSDRIAISPEARKNLRGMARFYVEAGEVGQEKMSLTENICAIVDHENVNAKFMPQSPFGICARSEDRSLIPAQKLGCKWTKLMDMANMVCEWPAVEPEKGKFVWNTARAQDYVKNSMAPNLAYDEVIDRYYRRGIDMVGVLWRCPLWASSAPEEIKKKDPMRALHYPPADLEQWANYFSEVVKRDKGKVKYWEVWNEPWWDGLGSSGTAKQYGDLVLKTREVLDKLDPDAKLLAFGIIEDGHEAWKKVDVISDHRYFLFGYPDETNDVTWTDYLRECRAKIRKNAGRYLPIWNMEMAINSGTFYKSKFNGGSGYLIPSPVRDYRSAANCLIRVWVVSMANGCEKTIYYFWTGVGGGYSDSRYSPGLGGRTVKPLAMAFATGAALMGDSRFDRQISLDDRLRCYLFKNPDHCLAVFWGRYMDEKAAKLQLPRPDFKTQAVDIMNNEFAYGSSGDSVELPLSAEPVFLKLYADADQAADWLKKAQGVGLPAAVDNEELLVGVARKESFERAAMAKVGEGRWVQINLRPMVNMSFGNDLAARDGKGGWDDQGPGNDFRDMPLGSQWFYGVPFDIINPKDNDGKSCVLLRTARTPSKNLPTEVTAPVGEPLEALFFLYASTWGAESPAKFVIEYDDGTAKEIEWLDGDNVCDWWNQEPLKTAHVRPVSLKTTGRGNAQSVRSLYAMEWVNPYPKKPIRQVRFVSGKSSSIPLLIAVTGLK